jgi:hypothetical protein
MTAPQSVCNYAMLRFLPHPETGEFVNVGVIANCLQPCFLHFLGEQKMPGRVKALFPDGNEKAFETGMAAIEKEMKRVAAMIRDPKDCQISFNEVVRPRESIFRFGEVRTIFISDPLNLAEELFKRYVRMEAMSQGTLRANAAATP